jgi:hypothetical protein
MKTMTAKLVAMIREEMAAELATKTGWGRNEIQQALERAIARALVRLIDG